MNTSAHIAPLDRRHFNLTRCCVGRTEPHRATPPSCVERNVAGYVRGRAARLREYRDEMVEMVGIARNYYFGIMK